MAGPLETAIQPRLRESAGLIVVLATHHIAPNLGLINACTALLDSCHTFYQHPVPTSSRGHRFRRWGQMHLRSRPRNTFKEKDEWSFDQ